MINFKPSGNIISFGSIIMDIQVMCDKFPALGETVYTDFDYSIIPGGKGANQAVAASRLGGKVQIIGKISDDDYGQIMKKNLEEAGVDISNLIVDKNSKSGVAFVWVDKKGNNQIICAPAGNSNFLLKDLTFWQNNMQQGDILIITMEYDEATIYEMVKVAKSKNCLVILDPATVDYKKLTPRVAEKIDIIKPNEVEIQFITGIEVTNLDSASKAIEYLKKLGIKYPVITLGGKGVIFEYEGNLIHQEAIAVAVVDTTAAGDTFIGALASKLSLGKSLPVAVEYANLAASWCVKYVGAQTSIPFKEDIQYEYMLKYKD